MKRREFVENIGSMSGALMCPLLCNTTDSLQLQVQNGDRTLFMAHAYSEKDQVIITAFKANRYSDNLHNNFFKEIRIYRLPCPDFVYGTDYEEYFYNLDYKQAELIFQGMIEPILQRKYVFVDNDVKDGSVYSYWIASFNGIPAGPLPVKVRSKDVWWSYDKIRDRVKDLGNKYPEFVKTEEIGYSVNRRPIWAIKAGLGRPGIALIGAIHAGESGPELIIPVLESLLKQNMDLLKGASVIIIPSVNFDNRDRLVYGNPWYLRKNSNGVDLNRNFPAEWDKVDTTYGYNTSDAGGSTFRGPFPGSEPETIAVMDYLKRNKPHVVFSFHWLAGICGETLLASNASHGNKDYVERCKRVAKFYWEGIDPLLTQDIQVRFDCTSGSLSTWCNKELGIVAFDVENPLDPDDKIQSAEDRTDNALLEKYQKRHLNGLTNLLSQLIHITDEV